MGSKRLCCVLGSLIALGVGAPAAIARQTFKPRIRGAMGIVPVRGHQEFAAGPRVPVVFHAGTVMRHVTVHTIFWAPGGYHFNGSPSAGAPSYEQLMQQLFADIAHDSGGRDNVFSVLPEYADRFGPGAYQVAYDPNSASDSIDDPYPYPPASQQCPSPAGVAACVTDLQIQHEIDRVRRSRDPSGGGLHDLWLMFLPPDVDTCFFPGKCGTSVFAGYHALFNSGQGPTIYAVVVDPLIEFTPGPGADPQGNPDAEVAADTATHEAVEAISDPEGTGWMDPNGFEAGDKCDVGPQLGTPLGYAPNGSPYNQVIGGHRYLLQTMWSNSSQGCVQRSSSTSSPLPLPIVRLGQFNRRISGDIGTPTPGVSVLVVVARAGTFVAALRTSTRGNGTWGPVALQSLSARGQHPIGDDRDEILVEYGRGGPTAEEIETGSGGNPFNESGYTGWSALDHGYAVSRSFVLIAPCGQVGVLGLTVGAVPTPSPVEQCETETDVAPVLTRPIRGGTSIIFSSEDNRAVTATSPNGALVKLTIPVGEPDSVSAVQNRLILFNPSGFPTCAADLRAQTVRCSGLVPGNRYAVIRGRGHATRRARADSNGTLRVGRFRGSTGIRGGDLMTLRNGAGRALSALHVAHVRVDLKGRQTVIAGGSCEPGDYWGPPLGTVPVGIAVGFGGVGGTGRICPLSGRAGGLPTADIAQTDDFSGGQTVTRVPDIETTAPLNGETLYGAFIAFAQAGLPGPNGSVITVRPRVRLTITPAGGGPPAFRAANVDTPSGVSLSGLAPGAYTAKWVLRDGAGDTRTVNTRLFEEL